VLGAPVDEDSVVGSLLVAAYAVVDVERAEFESAEATRECLVEGI